MTHLMFYLTTTNFKSIGLDVAAGELYYLRFIIMVKKHPGISLDVRMNFYSDNI